MASPDLGDGRVTREWYWRLVDDGVIGPDDRVELLQPIPAERRYTETLLARPGEAIALAIRPGATLGVHEILPSV